MKTEEEANELSWLKGGSKKSENSPLRPQDRDDDTPSWLYEDTVPEQKESTKAGKVVVDNKVAKSGVKWKQRMTTNTHADEDEVEESCCCCCPSDPMLFSFQCFHLTAGLSGMGAFVANIYVFTRPHVTVKEAIIRSYALIFCLLMVATEMDWRYIVNKARFLDWWVLRGFFYTFIGFITCKLISFKSHLRLVDLLLWRVVNTYPPLLTLLSQLGWRTRSRRRSTPRKTSLD